jgi:hypothetical protein
MKAPNDYADLLASDPTRTAPPKWCLLLALVLVGALNGCTTQRAARPATKADALSVQERDARTRRVEPYLLKAH